MSWLARLSPCRPFAGPCCGPPFSSPSPSARPRSWPWRRRGNWGFAFGIESRASLPVWLAVTAIVSAVLIVPPALFLALWRFARR